MRTVDQQAFGFSLTAEEAERERRNMDLGRFRVAFDGSAAVGVAGSWDLRMTLPGGRDVPTGGVTWVSVAVTHRRQGVLKQLMQAVHDDIDERGEPLAALTASEGGIYERFDYGIATRRRVVSIDRRRAVLAEQFRPPPGAVRLVDPTESLGELREVWSRYRATRAGEIDRGENWFRASIERNPNVVYALHADGYAAWSFENRWNDGHPAAQLFVETMAPVTAEAHAALWHTVLTTDLVGPVRTYAMPLDDPLPFLVTDQRLVRTTDLNDNVWCNVRDMPGCFGARVYGTDDDVVVEVDGARWRIGAAGVSRVRCPARPRHGPRRDRRTAAGRRGAVAARRRTSVGATQHRRPSASRRHVRRPSGPLLPDGVLRRAGSLAPCPIASPRPRWCTSPGSPAWRCRPTRSTA